MKQLYKNLKNISGLKAECFHFVLQRFPVFCVMVWNLVHHPLTPRKRRAVNSYSSLFYVGAQRMYFNSLSFPGVAFYLLLPYKILWNRTLIAFRWQESRRRVWVLRMPKQRIQTKSQINPATLAISTMVMILMIFIITIMIRLLRMYHSLIPIFIKKLIKSNHLLPEIKSFFKITTFKNLIRRWLNLKTSQSYSFPLFSGSQNQHSLHRKALFSLVLNPSSRWGRALWGKKMFLPYFAYCSLFFETISFARRLWYLKRSWPIPPVVVNIRVLNVSCSMSRRVLEYWRFLSFSRIQLIFCGSRLL